MTGYRSIAHQGFMDYKTGRYDQYKYPGGSLAMREYHQGAQAFHNGDRINKRGEIVQA